MALLIPSDRPALRTDSGLFRELEVLQRLEDSLPDGYEVFHSVSWHSVHEGNDRHGEIDVVILAPNGNMLLMEIKAGSVILRNGQIYKMYGADERDVDRQIRVQYSAMVNRLKEAGLHPKVTNCLVLPDYVMGPSTVVAFPRHRIVDAHDYDHLGTKVREFLAAEPTSADQEAIHHFLRNEFRVSTDLGTLRTQLKDATYRLSDGLATWVPRISSPSSTFRIQATAGSGKTQLALRLLENASASAQRALYVCFNRPLADHIARIAPTRAQVASFHELCIDHYRQRYQEPDFTVPNIFTEVTNAYLADSESLEGRFDLIIVDEGQDFDPMWVGSLLPQLKPDGRFFLMEDDDQRLYQRDAFDLGDAVTIACRDNYRSPRAVCQAINAFGLASSAVDARSPFTGELPGFHVYESKDDLVPRTVQAIQGLLKRGFQIGDIAVLSGHGHGRSVLLAADKIGDHTCRRYTGKFSKNGDAIWTEGALLVESIYRFKGQSAPAVVISEIDFEALSPSERRKLFVGMTRAQMAVEVVMTAAAEQSLTKLL